MPKKIEIAEVVVSYSAGCKASLGVGTYESADFHISRTERFAVDGLTQEEADALWLERYEILKKDLDTRIVEIHEETSRL